MIWNGGIAKSLRSLLRLAADDYSEQEQLLLRLPALLGHCYIWSGQKVKWKCTKGHYATVASKRSEPQTTTPRKDITGESFWEWRASSLTPQVSHTELTGRRDVRVQDHLRSLLSHGIPKCTRLPDL